MITTFLNLFAASILAATGGAHDSRPAVESVHGKLTERTVFDSTYKRPRKIIIYTPAGYSAAKAGGYDLILAFDGFQHLQGDSLNLALDSLAATGRTGPFVAVLVDDSVFAVRNGDLANQSKMVTFIGKQLMPWVRKNWNVTTDPHRSIILGSSGGGLEAAYVALERPDLFGNVLSQSGAFWRGPEGESEPFEWLTDQYRKAPKKDIRFVLDVGAMETMHVLGGAGPTMVDATRRLRDVLLAKQYEVIYTEVPNGHHDPRDWEPRLPYDLVAITKGWPKRG